MQIRQSLTRGLILSSVLITTLLTIGLMLQSTGKDIRDNSDKVYRNTQLINHLQYTIADIDTLLVACHALDSQSYCDDLFDKIENTQGLFAQLESHLEKATENQIHGVDNQDIELAFEYQFAELNGIVEFTLEEIGLLSGDIRQLNEALKLLAQLAKSPDGKLFENKHQLKTYFNLYQQSLVSFAELSERVDSRFNLEIEALKEKEQRFFKHYWWLVSSILIMLVVEYYWGNSKIVAPIETLSDVARNLKKGNYHQRTDVETENEVGELAQTFNEMAQAIEEDIDNRKKLSDELVSLRVKADAANQAKSHFLANMSHEIRTPLNGIIGMAYLALQGNLPAQEKGYVNKVHSASVSLLGIINDILDLSKVEAGKLVLENQPFDSNELFEKQRDLLGMSASQNQITLSYSVDPQVPKILIGDALRIGQVLNNLLGNAIKFTNPGGNIEVSLRVLENQTSTVRLEFSVQDTGIGMSAEQIDKVFSSFTQADSSITRRYGGSGLGLTISKQLVELMAGKMAVTSEEGVGSTFSFTCELGVGTARVATELAANKQGEKPVNKLPKNETGKIQELNNLTILLVEDNKLNLQVATKLLQRRGANVITAENGLIALEMVKQHRIDCVLMDCQMPVMDGYTATKEIRKLPVGNSLPIIALTANVMPEEVERCEEAGMDKYVAKPIFPNILFPAIFECIEEYRPSSAIKVEKTAADAVDQEGASTTVEIAQIEGIDTRLGLSICDDDISLYKDVLQRFITEAVTINKQIKEASEQDDLENLKQLVHTLKGIAANVGARKLHRLATVLYRLCHADVRGSEQKSEQISVVLKELTLIHDSLVKANLS